MKKTYAIGSLAIFLCCLSMWLYFLFAPVVSQKSGYIYYVRPAITRHLLIKDLAEQGIITHPIALLLYALPQKNSAIKVGEYHFLQGASSYSIYKQITNGTGLFYRPLKIIPGWTFKQLRSELLKAQGLRHTTAALTDQQIMQELGHADLSPEGEFFPETYNYTRGNTDLSILKRAFNLMQNKLQQLWSNHADNLPYKNSYDALIMASMIEKEAYLDAERPIIAGVIINRLKKDMLLQIDATVIYGLGDSYDGKIYKKDLHADTPYNTYLRKGLPPTPIAMPGLSSLQAAMRPQQNDFYYYVAKGNGSHDFSNNLQQHNQAVQLNKQSNSTQTH